MATRNAAQGNQTLKYDPERRPVRVDVSGQTSTTARLGLIGDGVRRKRLDQYWRTYYLGSCEDTTWATCSAPQEEPLL
jgi:hypothetical protein